MKRPRAIPTASDLMVRDVITLDPAMPLLDAIHVLLESRISGAPVVDTDGTVVGILSEHDCLRIFAADEYTAEDYEEAACVRAFMNTNVHLIPPDLDLYGIVQQFRERSIRRLPVVRDGKLIGQVSRRDVLGAIDHLREERLSPGRPEGPTGLYLSATDASPDAIRHRRE